MNKKIAMGGMLLAVEAVLLMMINFVPVNTIFIMAICSLISSVIIMEYGCGTGAVFSVASVRISFLIIANKLQWIFFVLTFAVYGTVKEFIERGRGMKIEWVMKLVFANIIFAVLYIVMRELITDTINPILIALVYNIAFVVYDIVYSQFIVYYEKIIRKNIKRYF